MEIKNADVKRYEKLNKISLPKDILAEECVIGSLIYNPLFKFKLEFLKARMFYDEKLATVFYIIDSLQKNGIEEIDTFLIESQIKAHKNLADKFKEIDNVKLYLDSLKESAKTDIKTVIFQAKNISSCAFKRDSHIKLAEMSKNILEVDSDINSLNYTMQRDITKFADGYITNDDLQVIGDVADDIFAEIEEDRERGLVGLPMSLPSLNQYFTLEDGEVVLIGGRAKGGKSMIFCQEAINKATNGVPVMIWDTEMNTKSWVVRALSHLSGVPIRRVKTGDNMSEEEKNKLDEAKRVLKTLPIYHMYKPTLDIDDLYMTTKQLLITKKIGLLIIDYLKISDTSNSSENEYNALGNMAIGIKDLSGELNIPVLMGAQLHHEKDKLGDSSKIERYVSTVCFWLAKTAEEKARDGVKAGTHKLIVSKNRNGMQHDTTANEYLNFVFNPSIVRIYEAEVSENIDGVPY